MKRRLFAVFLIVITIILYVQTRIYSYDFAVAAIFQNEAPYLKEWIEYHRLVGAKHFYLYNNESTDNFKEVLQPYIDKGFVELYDWHEPDFVKSGQKKAYGNAIEKAKNKVKWLAILDIDEFIVPKEERTIPKFLTQFEKKGIGGVGINWQMFGTSHIPQIKENELLVEKLIQKAPSEHGENLHIKSIVRPEYVTEPHVHYFEYQEGWSQVDSDGNPFQGSLTESVHIDKIQINHYWTKDELFFYSIKVPRRLQWGESMETINLRLNTLNRVQDRSIFRFIPQLKQNMKLE